MRKIIHILRIYFRNVFAKKLEPETPFLKYALNRGDTVLHIGASDGRHSYYMSPLVADGRIHAFEPSAYTCGIFQTLNRLHGLKNVTAHHLAMADHDGTVELGIPQKPSGRLAHSFSHVFADGGGEAVGRDYARTEKVGARRIDSLVPELGLSRVDFVRCDTEGSEMAILEGGRQTIERDLPSFLIEIHPVALKRDFGVDPARVRDFFLDLGYRMAILGPQGLEEVRDLVPGKEFLDYFCVHPSRAASLPAGPLRDLMVSPPTGS